VYFISCRSQGCARAPSAAPSLELWCAELQADGVAVRPPNVELVHVSSVGTRGYVEMSDQVSPRFHAELIVVMFDEYNDVRKVTDRVGILLGCVSPTHRGRQQVFAHRSGTAASSTDAARSARRTVSDAGWMSCARAAWDHRPSGRGEAANAPAAWTPRRTVRRPP
jgi:hypothetical protein